MTWGGENDHVHYEKKPRNGCRGLFFAGLFSLALAAIVVIVILVIKC